MIAKIRPAYNVLQAPYIKVDATIIQNGKTNGIPNIRPGVDYVVAPTGKKIATYIVNQIFGSDLVTQTEGLNINWLMPTLKSALELSIYQKEAFIYIHKFDNKVYLECLKKSDIHGLEQRYDKVYKGTVVEDIDSDTGRYVLKRHITIENGNSYITFEAFEKTNKDKEVKIDMAVFNYKNKTEYLENYILPYEVLVNVDIGQDFFSDSRKLLNEEVKILNTIADEVEKTRTRIVTSQHYQTNDIVTNWVPGGTSYKVDTLTVGKLQDYFTLLPGDKEHQLFEFLQGNVRTAEYINTFTFYDKTIIQMAGLSPASFGYEKDAYMNEANVDLSKNASDMTVEAIKTQIEPQINNLIANIVKAQKSQNITENELPVKLVWDYGNNEKLDDMKKLQILKRIQNVASVPYSVRAKIFMPILKKLIDQEYTEANKKEIEELISENAKDNENITVNFGEI